jgi:serine/threonine protein phosphatase PrpC
MSDPGRVRPRNEDALAVEPGRGIMVVADGMGGAPAGEVASAMAVQEVTRALHEGKGTVTALHVDPGAGTFILGHVGDSRAYHLSGGIFFRRTTDHTLVRSMVEEGRLPVEAERDHPMSHILTRAVGVEEELEVEVVEGTLADGDRFLLCSDGLGRVLEEDEIGAWIREIRPDGLEEAASDLVEEANRRGAPDNVTVALLVAEGSADA